VINITTDNIFVIKTTTKKYLNVKRGRIYWCMVDMEKASDSKDREALWFKMGKTGVSENMVKCIKKMYEGITFCVKCDDNLANFVERRRGVRQGRSVRSHLFNIVVDDVSDYTDEGNTHAPAEGKMSIPGLLFADDLAIGLFSVSVSQKGIGKLTFTAMIGV
jgi:hypothetical protein